MFYILIFHQLLKISPERVIFTSENQCDMLEIIIRDLVEAIKLLTKKDYYYSDFIFLWHPTKTDPVLGKRQNAGHFQ